MSAMTIAYGAPPVPAAHDQSASDKQRMLPHVIAITSGKGGVGKSSIAVNLGISLAKAGARVCIFDADTGLANINILLGLTPQFSLEHVLFGAKTIEEVMLEGPCGLKVVPGANGISECVSLHPRQQMRLTRELARIEGDFDYLLLDTAAGIADTTLDFVGSAHQALVVITPEPTSLTDAFSLVKLMHRRRPTMSYRVVVNMCSTTAQAREVYHRFSAATEKYIGVQTHYLGFLLRDESLRVAVSLQSPVALFPDTDPSSRSFIRLADALQQALENSHPSLGFSGFWQRQYRQRQAAGEGKQPAAGRAETANQHGYLAELKARLLLLLEREDAPQDELAGLLDESHRAYVRRFARPAFDPAAFIDSLVAAPDRDDELLRRLAARFKPWSAVEVPAPAALPETAAREAEAAPAVTVSAPSPSFTAPAPIPAPAIAAAAPPSRPVYVTRHRYHENRLGSQDALLQLLQRQDESGKSALELIDILG
jgi:MinD-like ATPase involved in chromosome partitioning or flagellar assembly